MQITADLPPKAREELFVYFTKDDVGVSICIYISKLSLSVDMEAGKGGGGDREGHCAP